jgi:hypothetical protein
MYQLYIRSMATHAGPAWVHLISCSSRKKLGTMLNMFPTLHS